MKKNAFTLIELLASICIVGVLSTIVITVALKRIQEAKEQSYKTLITSIEQAAKDYVMNNENDIPTYKSSDWTNITIETLISKNYFTQSLINPLTNKSLSIKDIVYVTRSNTGNVTATYDVNQNNKATITLIGGYNIYLENGKSYQELGITAKDINGNNVTSSVVVTGTVNSNVEGVYVKTYTYNNTSITRNIIVGKNKTIQLVYYTLTLNLNGGSYNGSTSNITYNLVEGERKALPIPTKQNYNFLGWTGGTVINNTITMGTSNITLTAKYFPKINIYNFNYTGEVQVFTFPETGYYKIEVWGASGYSSYGGKAAYISGKVYFEKNDIVYIFIGSMGNGITRGYNGGGKGNTQQSTGAGGGSTDIRYIKNNSLTQDQLSWNNEIGLKSRILVAAGGAGGNSTLSPLYAGGGGGGLTGLFNSGNLQGLGGSQTSGGEIGPNSSHNLNATKGMFGIGGNAGYYQSGAGGGGYYGGGGGTHQTPSTAGAGGGGSSYISGHTGCVAIVSSTSITPRTGTNGAACTTGTSDNLCSIHYSNKVFTNTLMIDGAGYTWTNSKASTAGTNLMPNPAGGTYASGVGHTGNGYARITYIGESLS